MGWEVVGYSSDPIPDDPTVVAAGVAHLRAVATDLQQQIDRMPTVGESDALQWNSDAAEGFRQVIEKLPKNLEMLKVRYEKVATALDTFQQTLAGAKAQARDGLAKGEAAASAVAAAQAGVTRMNDHTQQAKTAADRINTSAPPGTLPVQPEPWTGPNYQAQLSDASHALQQAKALVDAAVARFRSAAQTAAHAVDQANHDGLKNDTSLWGSITGAISGVAQWLDNHLPLKDIASLLGKIAAVAGILSLVPGLQWLAPIAVIAAAGALLCDAALIVSEMSQGEHVGTGQWISLGLDVVSVAAVGAGALISGPAENAAAAARVASSRAAADNVFVNVATSVREADALKAAQAAQRASDLSSGWKAIPNTMLGRTGRAETQALQAQQNLDASILREQQLSAAAAASRQTALATARTAQRWKVAGATADAIDHGSDFVGVGKGYYEQGILPISAIDPGAAMAVSTVKDVGGMVHYYAVKGQVGQAGGIGSRIPAQAIP